MAKGWKIASRDNADCTICDFRRAVSNKAFRGPKIPDGPGKCTRPGGLCEAKERSLAAGRSSHDDSK